MIERDIVDVCVWVFQAQRAHVMAERADMRHMAWLSGGVSNVLAGDHAQLGCRVDGGGPSSSAVHDDALTVYVTARRALAPGAFALVLEAALADAPPDAMAGVVPRPRPVIGANGKPEQWPRAVDDGRGGTRWEVPDELHRWTSRRGGALKYAPACILRYLPDPDTITLARESWTLWRDALIDLVGAIEDAGGLSTCTVTGPDPVRFPAQPWERTTARAA